MLQAQGQTVYRSRITGRTNRKWFNNKEYQNCQRKASAAYRNLKMLIIWNGYTRTVTSQLSLRTEIPLNHPPRYHHPRTSPMQATAKPLPRVLPCPPHQHKLTPAIPQDRCELRSHVSTVLSPGLHVLPHSYGYRILLQHCLHQLVMEEDLKAGKNLPISSLSSKGIGQF